MHSETGSPPPSESSMWSVVAEILPEDRCHRVLQSYTTIRGKPLKFDQQQRPEERGWIPLRF
ncbi:hypothetical protein [Oryza sativa Japonica Group]|uniref:p0460E08.31 protein n=1 Tax=Oryza sativa subsp. japonica TaxID=39947 RepID=Q94DR7_ORYSJ|nr:P0460E08.31 [Oryza sativa Japonica Group]BAB92366.1 hypothetical protein [Oryza sativa Japonica Group]